MAGGARAAGAEGCPSREGTPGPDRRELVSRGSQRENPGELIDCFFLKKSQTVSMLFFQDKHLWDQRRPPLPPPSRIRDGRGEGGEEEDKSFHKVKVLLLPIKTYL